MKILVNILLVVCSMLMALWSCESSRTDDVLETTVPEHGYIVFNTEIGSRGALLKESLKDHFGVLGYSYDESWEAAKSQAIPNVFYNEFVKYKEENNVSVHEYEPLVSWGGTQVYSFFGYYPYSDDLMAPSPNTYEGNPYVVYTLASRSEVTELVDVMTAQVFDTNASARTVDFVMQHRLTAIDVVARNFSENDVTVEVSKMKITFNNLLYDKVKIPLNAREEPDLKYEYGVAGNTVASYTLVEEKDEAITVTPNELKTITSGNKSMIVIPQEVALEGTIDITFKNSNGTEKTITGQAFTMNKEPQAGRRYYIQLAFTQEDITIAIVESEEWADIDNIYHEFE